MSRKLQIIFIMILLIIGSSKVVLAAEVYTATSTINNVTVNWEYELDSSNQIEKLVCKNPAQLTGKLTVPNTLNGKTVVALGNGAFKSATKITEVVIPNSLKKIGEYAFSGCTNLSKVDLGSIEELNENAFKNCTTLAEITIPKTLKTGPLLASPFSGCTNLKNIMLEDGMIRVPNYICADTPITEITMPSTVKEIGLWSFKGCTSLSKVELGNVEKIDENAFKNCTALVEITIPKTLQKESSGAVFKECTNLKKITLEEGMTIVPNYICADTPITEITIPNTVKEIGLWSFSSCEQLKKITIPNNVEKIGDISSSIDYTFKNHNEDLTIYCYKDSIADRYAIKYNIKREYLTKPVDQKPGEEDKDNNIGTSKGNTIENSLTSINQEGTNKKDNTVITGKLPKTGVSITIVISILVVLIIGSISYKKYYDNKDI